jgi:hypothetical protein
MTENELYKRCLTWMDETGAAIAIGCDLRSWWWGIPVAPPEELRETLDDLAREAVVDNDGEPTGTVRGWLGDPEFADEEDLEWLEHDEDKDDDHKQENLQ